ncbi:uncharacterized protein LOC116851823 [Odontomachus brunneus]|uniref:uncharacterized protein LOC116851823 n=1 Tax=Odontomachus brunneus TaxID=486640 RepID=UPI0013F1FFA2|nr:uncharacterized protein LOC116851823 [Odontomachus brunneus]
MAIPYIDTHLLTRGQLPVYITRVESPTLFWVQLDYNRTRLTELQEDLNCLMERRKKRYTLFPHAVHLKEAVAVKNEGKWYRGEFTAIRGNSVTVHLGDWGRNAKKAMWEVYRLPKHLCEDSWYAIACGLCGVEPTDPGSTWGAKARSLTKALIEDKKGWMKIKRTTAVRAVEIDLRIHYKNQLGSVTLREELVRLGQAQLTTDTNQHPQPFTR